MSPSRTEFFLIEVAKMGQIMQSVSNRQIVVLDQTRPGVFHGHVRSWAQLTPKMRSVLIKGGFASSRGLI